MTVVLVKTFREINSFCCSLFILRVFLFFYHMSLHLADLNVFIFWRFKLQNVFILFFFLEAATKGFL